MSFIRERADNWHRDVPGVRWFKADLHLHTIDDLAGNRAKMPAGVTGDPKSPETLAAYARQFLQGAVQRGVQVLGLTPHSPRVGTAGDASAVWKIVEEWNNGIDDDNVPFRRKIYAVFPGFEPDFKQGSTGLHLLFLFDPEIGCDDYLKVFDLTMGGVSPWRNGNLQVSNKSADEAFAELRRFHDRECPTDSDDRSQWRYIILAPHIDAPKGLLGAQKAQVLQLFEHESIAGLELGDEKLPEDTLKNRPWLRNGLKQYRQAFFHGSDAYCVEDIGKRHTWMKLASPRIEALRQAFIASDSRVRIGFCQDGNGGMREISNPPDVTVNERPWLKSAVVRGGASFFGGNRGNEPRETRFDLSPDLTCIIGGSMTGKSTLLDGLRVHIGAPESQDKGIKEQVEARGRLRFLAGSAEVELECPGRDPTAPLHEQWAAIFYAQNELQRLAQESTTVEEILARLGPSETPGIEERRGRLEELDHELGRLAIKELADLDEKLTDAEQAYERARIAKEELAMFSQAGVDNLHRVARDHRRWQECIEDAGDLRRDLEHALSAAIAFEPPEIDEPLKEVLKDKGIELSEDDPDTRWNRIREHLRSAKDELEAWTTETRTIIGALDAHECDVRANVERALADQGLDAAKIKELQALNRQAALLASHEANLDQTRSKLIAAEQTFGSLLAERQRLTQEQRDAFDRVIESIRAEFSNRISVRRVCDGDKGNLDRFLRGLVKKGITRWWNDLEVEHLPAPQNLIGHLENKSLHKLGMSSAVQATFRECLTKSKRHELAAIRCPDRYLLEMRMDDGRNRQLDELSGGQRVSLLLSLLLETNDDRPLIIDQPEDELDNRFLFDTVLPALKKLKGRRQIVVATHNANIVVNGDADQVIQLEATSNRGQIAHAGAIEEPAVRDAIVRTVDGGDEAFRLRRLKYGF